MYYGLPLETLLLFAICLVLSAGGFYRVVYFISIGYAFSVTAMAAAATVLSWHTATWPTLVAAVLLMAYGLRLGSYLVARERTPSYQREIADTQARARHITRPKQVLIWFAVSLLYVLMFSPTWFWLTAERSGAVASGLAAWLQLGGAVVMALGLGLESYADRVKARFKQDKPAAFCDVGVYRVVRCPNYLGEILFWTGHWLFGIGAYQAWWQWLAATLGYACIVLIMMGSTKRLEGKQDERYGMQEPYQRYVKSVPVLFPFVPVYSLKSVRVFLE